jgi:hypothetical protein
MFCRWQPVDNRGDSFTVLNGQNFDSPKQPGMT